MTRDCSLMPPADGDRIALPGTDVAPAAPCPHIAQPPVRTYLHHAYTTGMLAGAPGGEGLLLNNYIQLRIAPDAYGHQSESVDFFPFVDYHLLGRLGHFELTRWDPVAIVRMAEAELLHRLRDALDRGQRVELFLDEYYVPTSAAFQHRHFRHQHLIVGHAAEYFIGIGYGADGSYGHTRIPAVLLRPGILSRERSKRNYASLPSVTEIAPQLALCPGVDVPLIARQLEDFLDGVNRYSTYGSYPFAAEIPGAIHGRLVYAELLRRLRLAMTEGRPFDPRFTRLLLERAALMQRRLEYFACREFRGTDHLARDWGYLAREWRAIHLQVFEHNTLSSDRPMTTAAERIIEEFEAAVSRELGIAEKTLSVLARRG